MIRYRYKTNLDSYMCTYSLQGIFGRFCQDSHLFGRNDLQDVDEHIILKNVRTQHVIRNLKTHSVELDILAEDIRGYYPINRKSGTQDITMQLDNGLHEKYYNLEYPTEDMRINELLSYFTHSDPFYRTENFPRIVERVRYFKIRKEGIEIMCEIADRIRKEGEIIGRVKAVLELLEDIGEVPSKTADRIRRETDLKLLGKWLKCAAKASSFVEFETDAGLLPGCEEILP